MFIYQDEIAQDDRTDVLATPLNGTVICRHENQATVGWRFANGGTLSRTSTSNHFRQRITTGTPSVSRLTTNKPGQALMVDLANGLWTCRLNGGVISAVPVGIYVREEGEESCMFLKSSSHIFEAWHGEKISQST